MWTVPQVSVVVGLTMWTETLWPEANGAGPYESTPFEMLQPSDELAASIDQSRPASAGSVSATVTP